MKLTISGLDGKGITREVRNAIKKLDRNFKIENIVFSKEEFEKRVKDNPFSTIIYNELIL